MPARSTFVAIALALKGDGEVFRYLTEQTVDINAITGPDLLVTLPKPDGTSLHDLFFPEGKERLRQSVTRADLPCLFVEDQTDAHFLVPLKGRSQADVADVFRVLADAAASTASLADLHERVTALLASRPMTEPNPGATPKPEPDATPTPKPKPEPAPAPAPEPAPKPPPDPQAPPEKDPSTPAARKDPWSVLQFALQKYPGIMKWVVIAAGMLAGAAIVLPFFQTTHAAMTAFLVMFVMMVFAVVFSAIARSSTGWPMRVAAVAIVWALTAALVLAIGVTMTSIIWKKPYSYAEIIARLSQSPVTTTALVVVAQEEPGGKAIVGATVMVKGTAYDRQASTNATGEASFDAVPTTEQALAVTVAASGFTTGHRTVDASKATGRQIIALTVVTPPPAPPRAVRPTPGPPTSVAVPRPSGLSATQLDGVWQIQAVGDIANQIVRDGTFEFHAQSDGRFVVTATFEAAGDDTRLSGQATIVGSLVTVDYTAMNSDGRPWTGRIRFESRASNRRELRGSVRLKSGGPAALTLRKVQ